MKNKFIYIVGLIAISAVVVFLGFFAIKKIISSTPSNSGKYIFLDNPTTYKGVLGLSFPINTTIVKSGDTYQNTTNRFKTYFKSDPTIKDGITFKNDTSQISFYTPVNQSFGQLQSTTPHTKGSTITYSNIFSSLDLRYTVSPTRLLEEFVVNDRQTAEKILSLNQEVTLTNVDNYVQQAGSINFFKNGKITFSLPQPVLYEQENRDIRSNGIEYQITGKDKNNLEVTKKITQEGADWLADPTRQYPIVIDLVIDNADTASNWVSSDPSGLTVSQENSIIHEGTGSVKLTAGGISTGTGADGNITVDSSHSTPPTYTINAYNYITGRSCADGGDAVNYSVTALTSTSATVTGGGGTNGGPATGCLATGDEILLINLQGTSTAYTNVGNYETLRVSSITSGNIINFTTAKTNYYGNGATDDTNIGTSSSNQRVMLQRVPNYNNVTVNTGVIFYPTAWNGTKGGVMAFRASGTVTVTGTISATGYGYRGGTAPASHGGPAGESFCGNPGGGNGGSYGGPYEGGNGTCGGGGGESTGGNGTIATGSATGGAGGGGGDGAGSTYAGGGAGGGGGYGSPGVHGNGGNVVATDGSTNHSGNGGLASNDGGGGGGGGSFGSTNLSTLFLGSGAGAGAVGGGSAGRGGNGGGIILIFANNLSVTTGITSNGGNGGNGGGSSSAFFGGAGGGGSGGSIKIIGNTLTIGSSKVSATGGSGGTTASNSGAGGAGGSGITAMFYSSLSGSTSSPTPAYNTYPYALNDTVTLTKSVNLSTVKYITFWVYSNQASQAMRFEFGQSINSEQTYDFTTGSAGAWHQVQWDISGISTGSRSAVQYFAFKVTNISNATTVIYFDDIEDNSPPNAPSIGPPGNAATDQILSPTFTTSTTDVDGDTVKYEIAICANSDMVTGCISGSPFSQTLSPTGWSNGSTPYASGATATYILQTTLNPGTTYYWRSQAIDPGGSGIYGAWSSTYSFTTSYVPGAPTLNYPSNGANGWPQAPAVSMHATDADSDYLRYQVAICTTSDMSTSCISGSPFTEPSGSPQTGWTGQDAQSSTAYASTPSSGTPFVFSPTLAAGTTYYWQARAIDPGGSNTYGSWSSTYTFTMGQINVPYSLQVDGSVNPPALTDQTPNFTAICSSANSGDTFNQYQIQVSTNPSFSSTVYDSGGGGTSMASCTAGSRSSNLAYVGTLALDGTTYYWRVKLYDSTSASWSGWSTEFATFKMNSAYNGTPTSCRLMQAADGSSLTLLWTDMTSNETGFEIQKNVGNTTFSPLITTAANVTSYSDPTATSTTYQYRVRADFASGSPTDWCTTTITNLTKGTLQMQGVILSN